MDTWDAIQARRDVRQYADRPIAGEDLERILEAGRRAPSAQNRQPWDFVVVTDRTRLQELSNLWQGARHIAGSAATVALIGPEPENANQRDLLQYDFGQATANMMLAAADLGVGSGHAAVSAQAEAQRVVGLPGGRFCAYLIALGYPADRPLKPIVKPNRRPFEDVVHWDRW